MEPMDSDVGTMATLLDPTGAPFTIINAKQVDGQPPRSDIGEQGVPPSPRSGPMPPKGSVPRCPALVLTVRWALKASHGQVVDDPNP